jgi:glycine/D-amino acid oxidase-like deaminating enzyme
MALAPAQMLRADAVVVACGSYSAAAAHRGRGLPIYPGKGYSATFPLLKPEGAPMVSTIDDGKKIAMSRLGNVLRVAGTIELGGFDMSLRQPRGPCPLPHAVAPHCRNFARRVRHPHPKKAAARTGPACAPPRPPTSPSSARPAWASCG